MTTMNGFTKTSQNPGFLRPICCTHSVDTSSGMYRFPYTLRKAEFVLVREMSVVSQGANFLFLAFFGMINTFNKNHLFGETHC